MNTETMTQQTPSSAPVARRRGRAANIALWVVQAVTALGFLFAASGKLTGAPAVVATFDAIGFGDWFRYLVAALEIAGAVALLIPLLSGAAGLAFTALMIGAAATHVFVVGEAVLLTVPFLALAAVVAWGRRDRTAQLVRLVRTRVSGR